MLLFWSCCAILAAGVVLALTRPLMRRGPADAANVATADQSDLDIYRDQLAEIETDRERGLIAGPEAEAARTEVARRLLARARAHSTATPASGSDAGPRPQAGVGDRQLFLGIAVAVPLIALVLYLDLGAPGLPDQPAAQRQAVARAGTAKIDAMVAQVEARLREHPEDGQGFDVLAPVYLKLERFGDAAKAYQRAIDLLGASPRRLAGFAQATVLAHDGKVDVAARRAYERLLTIIPGLPEARFGLALAQEQDGNLDAAEAAYRAILSDPGPDGAIDPAWREVVNERLAGIAERRGGAPASGPASPAGEAVAQLPPAERNAMIERMVEGLETKLKADGRDVDGWQKLMRSWSVLGRRDRAEAALADARRALASDAAGLEAINAFAKRLGLGA